MAISSATSRNDYTGNGAVDTYAYTFKIFLESDLVVKVRDTDGAETTLTLTTHYTVTGEGDEGGGNVALVNGSFDWLDGDGDLKTDYTLTIMRQRPLTQTADFKNQGTFFGLSHENAFDHLVMIDQQQQDTIDRSFRLPPTVDPDDFEARIPASVLTSPGYVLAVNDDADGLTLIQVPDLDTVIDLDLGSSGNPGSLDIFPATAARGRLRFTAANSAGDTVTAIVNASQAGARTYTIPDAGTDAAFVMTAGAQTIAGVKTFSSQPLFSAGIASLALTATSNQLVLGTTNTTTITSPAPSASRVYTIPDAGGAAEFVMSAGNQTIAGTKTFSAGISAPSVSNTAGVAIQGTNTNNSASAGYVGERVSSTVGNQASPGTNQWFDMTSISLTAGDWEVWLIAANNSTDYANCSDFQIGIGLTSGNNTPGSTQMSDFISLGFAVGGKVNQSIRKRMSLTSTTTVYAKALMTFTAGTQNGLCSIFAIRVR